MDTPHANGPVMLVTGGSRGIGAAIVRAAAAAGYEIALTYADDRAAAEAVAAEVNGSGRRAVIVQADVAREADVLAAYAAVDDAFGRLDALAINAGITGRFTRVDEIDAATLERVLAVNVTGAFLCAREAVRRMSTARGGSGGAIVVVSSRAAGLGSPGEYVHYAASKAAVDTLTRGLAKEVARRGDPRERGRAGLDRHGDPRARRPPRARRAHHADDPDGTHRHGRRSRRDGAVAFVAGSVVRHGRDSRRVRRTLARRRVNARRQPVNASAGNGFLTWNLCHGARIRLCYFPVRIRPGRRMRTHSPTVRSLDLFDRTASSR